MAEQPVNLSIVVGPYCRLPCGSGGTSSERMRRYMHDVSDKRQQQFPEPARPRLQTTDGCRDPYGAAK